MRLRTETSYHPDCYRRRLNLTGSAGDFLRLAGFTAGRGIPPRPEDLCPGNII